MNESTTKPSVEEPKNWQDICALEQLPQDAGIGALLRPDSAGETQIALFRVGDGDQVHAVANFDPFSQANVLSRGILCSIGDELAVASPILKEHFSLTTGRCFEDDSVSIAVFPAQVVNGRVLVASD